MADAADADDALRTRNSWSGEAAARTPRRRGRQAHPSKMDAEEYLDRYGVTAYMKDVVTLLLENRPPEPIDFIADYFRTVIQGSSPLLRAYATSASRSRTRRRSPTTSSPHTARSTRRARGRV